MAKFQAAFFLKNLVDFLEAWGVCWQLVPVQPSRTFSKKKSVAEVRFEVAGAPARILPRGNN